MTRRGAAGRSPSPPEVAAKGRRAGWASRALLVVAVALVATTDARLFGLNPDGRVMLRTAGSMAMLGELGIARGGVAAGTVDRPGGDSVTRYGLLPSIVLVPAVAVGGVFESLLGNGAAQPLFAFTQIAMLLGAAAAAGGLARGLGGDERAAFRAATATVLSSPLWTYASSDFSEPLQAALLGAAMAASIAAAAAGEPRKAFRLSLLAGAALGGALLARSLLALALPFAAAILWRGEGSCRRERLLGALAGFAPLALLWAAFDLARFGRLFGGYAGERFSHPAWDGAWRLLVWPNTGLLIYFPLAALGVLGFARTARRDGAALPVAALSLALFAAVSSWWAWSGVLGWGPRLLLPLVPLLAAAGACEAARHRPLLFRGLFAAGLLVNLLGVLQPDATVKAYLSILPPRAPDEREARDYPRWTRLPADGSLDPIYRWASDLSLNPIRVGWWLLAQRLRGGDIDARLETPPWDTARAGLGPVRGLAEALPVGKRDLLVTPFEWPWLGKTLVGGARGDIQLAYLDLLKDQANRAQDMGRTARAVVFSERLWRRLPSPQTAVVLAESYRLAGRRDDLVKLTDSLWESGQSPDVRLFLVLGLFSRDLGHDAEASTLAAKAAASTARDEVRRWAGVPARSWPRTVREMTGESGRSTAGPPPG